MFQYISIYAAYLYDSVILYAKALHELLRQQTLLTDEIIDEVAKNGTKIVETIIGLGNYKSTVYLYNEYERSHFNVNII